MALGSSRSRLREWGGGDKRGSYLKWRITQKEAEENRTKTVTGNKLRKRK